MRKQLWYLSIVLVLLSFQSCSSDSAFNETQELNSNLIWKNDNPVPKEPSIGAVKPRDIEVKIHDDDALSTRVSLLDARTSSYVGDGREARKANYTRSYANAIVNQRIRKILLSSGAPVRRANIAYSAKKKNKLLSKIISLFFSFRVFNF